MEVNAPAQDANGFDFYIGQIEGPSQYDNLLASINSFRQAHPLMPAAVVTNTGGIDTAAKAKPFIDDKWCCIAEGHVCEDGVDPRQRVAWIERNLGWPIAQPMAGLGNSCTPVNYPGIENSFGYSWFTAERYWRL